MDENNRPKDGADGWKKAGEMSLQELKDKLDNLGKMAVNVAAMDKAARQITGKHKSKDRDKKKRKRKSSRAARKANR